MELTIEGRKVTVDDKFRDLSPADKEATIEEIAGKMGVKPGASEGPGVVGEAGRIGAKGLIGAVAGLPALVGDYLTGRVAAPINTIARLAGYGIEEGKPYSETPEPKPYIDVGMPLSGAVSRVSEAAAGKIAPAPTSAEGRIGEALATGAIEALGGSGLFRVAGKIFSSLPEAAAAFEALAAGPKTQAAYGAAAAGGGQAAQESGVNPVVGTVAGLAAAAGGHAVGAGLRAAPGAVKSALDENLVRTVPAQEARAAQQLREAATDPEALKHNLMFGQSPELVPGSRPTLYEATGDIGIGQATRRARTAEEGFAAEAEARRGEQNLARRQEIQALGGAGDRDAVLTEFRRQRDALDQAQGFREGIAQTEADVAASRAGTTATPEEVGTALRSPMEASRRATAAEGGRLYDAIASEDVTVGTGRLKAAIGKDFRDIAENPLAPLERQVADLIKSYGQRIDFGKLQELRKRVAAESRNYTANDVTRRRFTVLKQAIDQAMDDGLARAVKDDPSLSQRLSAAAGGTGGERGEAGARAAGGGIPTGTPVAEAGAARPPVGGPGDVPGGPRISPVSETPAPRLSEAPPPAPPFEAPPGVAEPVDAALTRQQRAANAFWRDYKQRFGQEPILKGAATESGFKMTEAEIPRAAFRGGDRGAERIRALRAQGAPETALEQAAAYSFSQAAIREGAVNPALFRRWVRDHASALSEFSPQARRGFVSAADATATLERVTAERAAALKEFDNNAVGRVLGIRPEDLDKAIGSYLQRPSAAADLARAVQGNPAARDGLRRLTADWMTREFVKGNEIATAGNPAVSGPAFKTFLNRNRPAMTAIFGAEGVERMQNLADDISRSQRAMVVGKDPAGPGTAGDLAALAKGAGKASVMAVLSKVLGPKGVAAVGVGKTILGAMKLSGIASADELFARALLDPELARKLLTRGPAVKSPAFVKGLSATIVRSSLLGATRGNLGGT
jgi:hypothetical protein